MPVCHSGGLSGKQQGLPSGRAKGLVGDKAQDKTTGEERVTQGRFHPDGDLTPAGTLKMARAEDPALTSHSSAR